MVMLHFDFVAQSRILAESVFVSGDIALNSPRRLKHNAGLRAA
jgi:hypothetical protein